MARTYSENVVKQRGNLSPEAVRRAKCQRSKSRNEARLAEKRDAAVLRQTEYDALSTVEKLALLDARLGKGMGAVKQRRKLQETA